MLSMGKVTLLLNVGEGWQVTGRDCYFGEVLMILSGKTVESGNIDAEGLQVRRCCAKAMEVCHNIVPELQESETGDFVACHLF